MRITEFIKELESVRDDHGDIEVIVRDEEFGDDNPDIEVHPKDWIGLPKRDEIESDFDEVCVIR